MLASYEGISKGVNEQPDGGAAWAGMVRGAWASQLLCEMALWIFMAASLHGHNRLNHWSLVINSTSGHPTILLPGGGGQGGQNLKVPTGITGLVPMATSPQSKGFPKVTSVKSTQMELKGLL